MGSLIIFYQYDDLFHVVYPVLPHENLVRKGSRKIALLITSNSSIEGNESL